MSELGLWMDESDRGQMLFVGGILLEWEKIADVVHRWRQMKKDLGLHPDLEVKWNIPSDSRTRKNLESAGITPRTLSEKAIDFIASTDMKCIVIAMIEHRQLSLWKKFIWQKASIRDFYCEGFKYLLQRAAEEVVECGYKGCTIVCDTPELGRKKFEKSSIRRGPQAVHQAYQEWYKNGVGVGPGKQYHRSSLDQINFHPSVLIGDATYHDMLQIADMVVGATGSWIASVKNESLEEWVRECMKALSNKFRARHGSPDFWGDGLVLWPMDNKLWESLKKSLS